MEKLRNFLREKGFVWVVLACVAAASLAGVWAVRTIRADWKELKEQNGTSGADAAGLEEYSGLEGNNGLEADDGWDTGLDVAGKAEDVPEGVESNGQGDTSASSSGSGSSSKSAAGQNSSGAAAAAPAPSFTQPVSGSVIKAFSGDELVFSKTLEDWRTHNGTDYACGTGDTVFAPVSGTVSNVADDGNWGGLMEITDANGRVWRICGVSEPKAAQGDTVVTGQQLGTVSVIGCENADGTHVHLEVLQQGKYIDPMSIIG